MLGETSGHSPVCFLQGAPPTRPCWARSLLRPVLPLPAYAFFLPLESSVLGTEPAVSGRADTVAKFPDPLGLAHPRRQKSSGGACGLPDSCAGGITGHVGLTFSLFSIFLWEDRAVPGPPGQRRLGLTFGLQPTGPFTPPV